MSEGSSYLAWPVQLRPFYRGIEAHITLKYLGSDVFFIDDLARRLWDRETRFLSSRELWTPDIFIDTKGEPAYVMVVHHLDIAVFRTRLAVDSLHKDHYPAWRPHITFERVLWEHLVENNVSMEDAVKEIGPLTLFRNKKAVYTF